MRNVDRSARFGTDFSVRRRGKYNKNALNKSVKEKNSSNQFSNISNCRQLFIAQTFIFTMFSHSLPCWATGQPLSVASGRDP
jgi:hypothetical protein